MNPAHVHLLVNHLPVIGSILGSFVLAYGMRSRTYQTKIAAYILFIVSGIGAVIAYVSGEPAEELIENIPGVAKNMIESHEDFAVFTLIGFIILGILSLFGLAITMKQSIFMRPIAVIILITSLVCFSMGAYTAYSGGQIRHPEIKGAQPANAPGGEHADDKDDD